MPKINFEEVQLMAIYIDRLVADKGLAEANRKQHGKISHELKGKFDEACQKAMIDALPEAKLDELNDLLTAGATDAVIEKFFDQSGVDFSKVIQETMVKFRADYLGTDQKSTNPATTITTPNTAEANNSDNMTNLTNTAPQPPAGNPAQGTTSEAPGTSNVEGVENITTVMTEENA